MSTLKQRADAKLTPFTLAHFAAWVETQPEDKAYNFDNVHGDCAIGQYMAAHGRAWDFNYTLTCREVFGDIVFASVALASKPQTFGGLATRLAIGKP